MSGFSFSRLKEKVSIGIIGIGMGCGVTHLTIALANYLQSGMGKKTAVIELSGQNALKDMIQEEGNKRHDLLGIHYFTDVSIGKIAEVINSQYEAFVLDLGGDYAAAREEFLRCDRKIVIGSISPWRITAYERFLKNIIASENYERWEFLVYLPNLVDKKSIQKRYGVNMISVPLIENPFYLKKEDMIFLQKII